ncbi:MAG: hypothetical protein ACREBU_21090 [Nitrososphaera sp.]
MAKKTTPPTKVRTVLIVSLSQARDRVYRQLEKGSEILKTEIKTEEELQQAEAKHRSWSDYTEELLKQMFNTEEVARKFTGIFGTAFSGGGKPPLYKEIELFRRDVQRDLERLASVYEQLELFPISPTGTTPIEEAGSFPDTSPRSASVTINNYGTIYNPQIQQGTTKSSQEIIATGASTDIRPLLDQLAQAVENMSSALPDEIARQARQDLSVFMGEATGNTPRSEWWQLSADGLKKAAADIGEIGKPVIDLVSRIVPLLIAISNAK